MPPLAILIYDLTGREGLLSRGERIIRVFVDALAAEHVVGDVYLDSESGFVVTGDSETPVELPDRFDLILLHNNNRFQFNEREDSGVLLGEPQCPIVRYTGAESNPLAAGDEIWFADPPVSENRPISVEAARQILRWIVGGAERTSLPPILGGTTLQDAAVFLLDTLLPGLYGGDPGDHSTAWKRLEGFRDAATPHEAEWERVKTAYEKLTASQMTISEFENLRDELLGNESGAKKGLILATLEARRGAG